MIDYVISDTHAFHNKMVDDKIRPFSTVDEMNKIMADNINATVMPGDRLFHCGDYSFGGIQNAIKFREMINCRNVYLTPGNHDERLYGRKEFDVLFVKIRDIMQIKSIVPVILSHPPQESWYKMHYGSAHFHGHVHHPNTLIRIPMRFNCCVDLTAFKPINIENKIREMIGSK